MKKRSEKADPSAKKVRSLLHSKAKRKRIPTAQSQPFMNEEQQKPIPAKYQRPNAAPSPAMEAAADERNTDLDPQLIWEGKDNEAAAELSANAPPIYIQEKIHPQALIEDLMRESQKSQPEDKEEEPAPDLFADYDGLPKAPEKTRYYEHSGGWQNRMILGDSLMIMASLLEREGMAGKAQVFYFDPPYGIKFNSNFQWTTKSRAVKDGEEKHITRQPEQVKAFRDTWKLGLHSYLTYMRDRLTLARELLNETGSIFLQIGDENVHLMRNLLDEVFGKKNFVSIITYKTTSGLNSKLLNASHDFILWFAKNKEKVKYRQLYKEKVLGQAGTTQYVWEMSDDFQESRISKRGQPEGAVFATDNLSSQSGGESTRYKYTLNGKAFSVSGVGGWKTNLEGMQRLDKAYRLKPIGNSLMYRRYLSDFGVYQISNGWDDVLTTGLTDQKVYIVQTSPRVIERCVLMASDPGDLVIDPTCGSGTTAYVSEQWGRRWIVMDTSRVALALARARMMGAKFPYYTLADSPAGKAKLNAAKK